MRLSSKLARYLTAHWRGGIFLGAAILIVMSSHTLERMLVYYPTRDVLDDPARIGLAFQDVFITTGDGVRLHGWFIPFAGARQTVLILHGNAGNIGHRVPWLGMLYGLRVNLLIVDYRGYGRSGGRPFEKGLYEDAVGTYLWWARNRSGSDQQLVLLGESLGGAVAVDLAARVRVDGLILQSTFTSAWDMAKTILPLGLLQPLIRVKFDSESKIRQITCPKLILHGSRDDIVPLRLGKRLYDAAMPPKDFCEFPLAGHNDLVWTAGPEYLERISEFLRAVESR